MNTLHLSPQQAAERAAVSRATIVRALQALKLQGIRGNGGRWRIDPQEVDRWSAERARTVHVEAVNTDHKANIRHLSEQLDSVRQTLAERDAQLARLEAEAAANAARLIETAADRDAWREQAQRLAERPEPRPTPPEPSPRRGLFRLFRK